MTRDEAITKVTAALERTGRFRGRSAIGADIATIEALGLITFDKTPEECDLRTWVFKGLQGYLMPVLTWNEHTRKHDIPVTGRLGEDGAREILCLIEEKLELKLSRGTELPLGYHTGWRDTIGIAERDATIEQLRIKIDDLKKAGQFSTDRIERLTAEVEKQTTRAEMWHGHERKTGEAYLRLRKMIPGAERDLKLPVSAEQVWRVTEEALAAALATPAPPKPNHIYPVGTVVKLRSGGPNMTVISHRPHNGSCMSDWASCEWWERGEKRVELLPEAALMPAHDHAQFRAEVNPAKAQAVYNARFAREAGYVHDEYAELKGKSCPCRMCRPAPQAEATVPRDPSAMKPKRAETSDHVSSAEVQLALRRAIGDPADWTNAEGLAYAIYHALRLERLWVVRRR